ncbi:GGDEF domain-containing protein, partial [Rhodoferax sp. UBA5149]|uniref:GGDEF domain-containing protein n=1 Tax=Rhodoferax sp. UBA5149 TaxID=1947379 RepID=UPI0025FB01C5
MPELVDNLADLTALRDRDALDVALVTAINDVLQPRTAAICRVVGEAGNERWRICAQLNAGATAPTSDSAWSKLDSLPLLSAYPLRQQAISSRQVQESTSGPSITTFPLGSNPGAIGVLEIGTDAPLSPDNRRLVSGVLRLYLNFANLLDYGERDALTELLNRKTFDGAFLKATIEQQLATHTGQEERRDMTSTGSYWLAMIDIDHFKRVNDNYGHLIGDEVLLLLARLMRAHFRFHDQLYRFGGEEFVVLMRCDGEAEAGGVLERLRTTTEKHPFPQVGTITISIGFSE